MPSSNNRKNEIRSAVLNILETDGVRGLTTARIAAKVGFSEPALYKYFKNKLAIIEFVLDERLAITKRNTREVRELTIDPVDRIKALFKRQLLFMKSCPGLYRLIYSDELHLNHSTLLDKLKKISNDHYRSLKSLVNEAVEHGAIKSDTNVEQLTMALMGCVHSAFAAKAILGKRGDIVRRGMSMIDLILSGVLI